MFTAIAHKNLTDAEQYFDEHLAQNDYYAAGEIRPGQRIGAGADRLGLKKRRYARTISCALRKSKSKRWRTTDAAEPEGRSTPGVLRFHLFRA